MGILDGGIQSLFGTVFGSFYLDATLIRVVNDYDDEGGTTETKSYQAIKIQEDSVSEEARAAGNFSQDEVRFLVLQSGVTGGIDGDCQMNVGGAVVGGEIVGGTNYALRTPQQDPTKSYWQVRGVPL